MIGDPYRKVPIYDLGPFGGEVVSYLRDFENLDAKIAFLENVADRSARGELGPIPELARGVAAQAGARTALEELLALHAFRVAYIEPWGELEEAFEMPRLTVSRRYGDCEDHAVLGAALAASLGHEYRLAPIGHSLAYPTHLSLLVAPRGARVAEWPHVAWFRLPQYPTPEGWWWSETSIAAELGEHPYAAARRLGTLEERPEFIEG